jgi:UPF0716 protein FxsA
MLARLFLLFIILPILDLTVLVKLGGSIGFWPTLTLVLLTGAAGAALARAEGLRVLKLVQRELAAGRVPGSALLDGVAILAGGLLLLTPGFITDVMGLALLLPPTRRWVKRVVRRWFEEQLDTGRAHISTIGNVEWDPRTEEPRDETRLDPRKEIPQRRREP